MGRNAEDDVRQLALAERHRPEASGKTYNDLLFFRGTPIAEYGVDR